MDKAEHLMAKRSYTDCTYEEKQHLWEEHQLQPCVYCGALTPNSTCLLCGEQEDQTLGKI